jgi:SlyX protein
MNEERLIEIETTLAHQEEQIESLNEVVTKQWQEIDLLKRLLQKTQAKLDDIEAGAGEKKEMSVSDEARLNKPPHY